jgi:hypothetical protein
MILSFLRNVQVHLFFFLSQGGGVNQLLPCLNNYASFKKLYKALNDDDNNAGK